jgi:hypothetical protein
VGLVPVYGDAIDIVGAALGEDLIAGESLSSGQRLTTAIGTVVLGTGRGVRQAAEVIGVAVLRRQFDNVVRPAFWKTEAVRNAGAYSAENLARMAKGKAPIGSDGFAMELHHGTPLANGGTNDFENLRMMTRTEHRLGENYKLNHPNLPPDEEE